MVSFSMFKIMSWFLSFYHPNVTHVLFLLVWILCSISLWFMHSNIIMNSDSLLLLCSVSGSVQSLSHVWLFATPWTAACQASLSTTNSRSLPKLMSIELGMSSNHLNLYCPLLLLPSIFPSIRVFSNESAGIGWPSHQVAKVLVFQLQSQSFQWIFRTDFL